MGSFFRSEKMFLCQLFIQPEAAYSSVAELGEAGSVQFRDLNADVNAFQRKFVNEVRRCDELERKLRYVEAEINKENLHIPEIEDLPNAPNPREITDLETSLEKTENEILELSQNAVNLKSNFLELTELKYVLEKTEVFFTEQEGINGTDSLTRALITEDSSAQATNIRGRLGFVAGVVPRERVPAFERMLWRISRGNVFLRQAELDQPLEDPSTGNQIYKTVFAAFFQGEQLKSRVKKVCTGFHASLYPCPSATTEREEMVKGVRTRLEDLNMVLNQTQDHRHRVLVSVAKELQNCMVMVRKMKAIYHTLNMFNLDVTKKCLIAECWVPVRDLAGVRKALAEGGRASGSSIPSFLNVIETSEGSPTFNRTNKFTRGFQNLIDSYGVSSYREVNPALYTIITFPFLFAIMFGDAGHGLILTAFGLYMVIEEKKLMKQKSDSEIWNIFFAGRYIILLMGIFSVYTGFIYNDIFSRSLNIFGSSWTIDGYNISDIQGNAELTLSPYTNFAKFDASPYPVGLDPVWQAATNKIIFLNSYKMKLSIIFGVAHMIFGVCLSVVNHIHFKKSINIILEFVPQILFLLLLFAYMVAMMFIKWVIYYPQETVDCNNETVTCTQDVLDVIRYGPSCAPSVLILFINMMLFKSSPPTGIGCQEFMFDGQDVIQTAFVVVAVLCIPVLLLAKPLYLLCCGRSKKSEHTSENGDVNQGLELTPEMVDTPSPSPAHAEHNEGDNAVGEIFILQGIHTIEYILSTISHTASYLRLWALSLAHAQLSEVLWTMVLSIGLTGSADGDAQSYVVGSILLYVLFAAWAGLTLAILVMMEGLSAFLHTLRLHWVEFMSKFYEGAGYVFQPFSFKIILEGEDVVED
ncbi:V-type proton ATPase 116 kDa subunit a [Zootermopsis nevadensis]|uniref:V-type proton ATPase subunit a n=1 Tax=Zootermopsis nevadensis TaxID=136037 RepID=A0A067RRK3_ZOONE|nr:V-type proton ATPase 116 kDa subunit a [Zootermopsis nevadensis]XP_021940969.1 V-type proton ATPase 116 kDa subunit a [Zootermopsis nevadensis]XP_021940975.1 V-type proton ATPase 116 kDa subunit a [Zootermopsis nevadensis]XP_021940985.1 V-type proton ATPase 116 kDa subunit a [Zootermopsis nevadensis]XP_021940991.1 V-type proton ATPase 116 kDa subunit a [Zootermopsis nevadensis]XP_021940998.1 V-type proton ATPase 116 kDa subunit a [Zootermopsis nevadensis]KDR23260.1 V-type proton ATPase 116